MDQVERQQGLSAQSEPLGQETVSDTREVTMAQPESTVPDGSSQMAPTQLPPLAAEHPQTLPPEELSGQTLPPASGLSPQKEAILHRALRLQNVSYTASDMPPDAARSGQPLNPPPDPPANPPPENPPLSSPPPPVSRPPSAAANTLKALLIPGLILAALLGALIALLLPQLLPRDLLPGWLGGTEQPVDIVLVQDLIRQGGSELQRGRYEDALKHYNEAIRLDRNAYDAYIGRGLANHRLGRRNEALRDYNRAIELIETERKSLNAGPGSVNLDPVLAQAYNNRSHVQFDLEQFPAAKDDANKAVTLNTNLAEAYINLGNARARLGELNESLQDYETAIRLKPGNTQLAGAYTNRGNVQVKLNQPPTAVQDYNRATQVKADYADAFFNRGIAHQLQKKYQNALADLQEAARLYGQQGNTRMQQRAEDLAKQVQQNQQLPNPPTADSL